MICRCCLCHRRLRAVVVSVSVVLSVETSVYVRVRVVDWCVTRVTKVCSCGRGGRRRRCCCVHFTLQAPLRASVRVATAEFVSRGGMDIAATAVPLSTLAEHVSNVSNSDVTTERESHTFAAAAGGHNRRHRLLMVLSLAVRSVLEYSFGFYRLFLHS